MLHFCTYFDVNYLTRGIALFNSLKKTCRDFRIYMFCLDDDTYTIINNISKKEGQIVAIKISEVESWDKELLEVKSNRSVIEYYFTLSPILPLYVLSKYPEVEIVTYVDADVRFYSDPSRLYEELGSSSILTIEHRFPDKRKNLEIYGHFNVQYQTFRRDREGIACLEKWREQCIEWCYDKLEDGKFADQKYLDEWPNSYRNLVVSNIKGAGLAPWNIDAYDLEIVDGSLLVNGDNLVFYHFHGLKQIGKLLYFTGLSNYQARVPKAIIYWLYKGYVKELLKSRIQLEDQLTNYDNSDFISSIRQPSNQLKAVVKSIVKRDILYCC